MRAGPATRSSDHVPAGAAGHRRQQHDRVPLADGRVERLEVADIRVVHEHVDEAVQVAIATQRACGARPG